VPNELRKDRTWDGLCCAVCACVVQSNYYSRGVPTSFWTEGMTVRARGSVVRGRGSGRCARGMIAAAGGSVG
jgi:hypothetical protein